MSAPQPKADPTVATLLTWFVPGAGHLYLGRVKTAGAVFLLVQGCYALGLFLSAGRGFEILPPEMRGAMAPFLAPELGNLGALLFQSSQFGFGEPQPSVFPATLQLGLLLTSLSGILNALVMAQANLDARRPVPATAVNPAPGLAGLASFLVPGLGQFLQGRRGRGILAFGLLVGLFLAGTLLGEGANLDRARHYYYWGGQFLLGLPAWITEAVHGHPRLTHEVPYHDLAVVLGCVAGLLNVLVVLDAFAWGEALSLGEDPLAGETARSSEEAPAS